MASFALFKICSFSEIAGTFFIIFPVIVKPANPPTNPINNPVKISPDPHENTINPNHVKIAEITEIHAKVRLKLILFLMSDGFFGSPEILVLFYAIGML